MEAALRLLEADLAWLEAVREAKAWAAEGELDVALAVLEPWWEAAEALALARETLRRTALQPHRADIAWLAVGEGDQRLHLAPIQPAHALGQARQCDAGKVLRLRQLA